MTPIKHKKGNKPFVITNTDIANQLIMLGLLKYQEIRIRGEKADKDNLFGNFEFTGKYIFTYEGSSYIQWKRKRIFLNFGLNFVHGLHWLLQLQH